MEQTKDLTTLSVTELIGTLQAHENRVSLRNEDTSEGVFNVRTRGGRSGYTPENNKSHEYQGKGQKWCGFCKRNNHTESDCWKKPKNEDKGENVWNKKECYNCGKVGHLSRECYSKKYEKAHMSLEDDDDEGHMLFSASEETPTTNKGDVWVVDSGCTNHMTREARYFTKLDRRINVPIKVGNGEVVMTTGKGDVAVMTNRGKRVIKDVFLVPEMEKNLLSVPQIISRGYRVLFEEKRCIISDSKGKKIMEIKMVERSFPIMWNSSQESATTTYEKDILLQTEKVEISKDVAIEEGRKCNGERHEELKRNSYLPIKNPEPKTEEVEGMTRHSHLQISDGDVKEEEEDASKAPKVMEFEDLAFVHEACFNVSVETQTCDEAVESRHGEMQCVRKST